MGTNSGYVYRDCVRPADAGARVLQYYAAHFSHYSLHDWELALSAGRVRINGRVAQATDALRPGDQLEYHRPPWEEPTVELGFQVLFEDEHLLVVVKPSGLQVLPAGPFFENTLLHQVRRSDPSRAESSPLHRLGRGTSGLILFGKLPAARAQLARQLREQAMTKTYLAWVVGTGLQGGCIARHPMQPVDHGRLRIHVAGASGKSAKTRVRVLRHDPAQARSLVAAQPISGRPDQIRVHLAALGAPIVGDPLFGVGGVAISNATPGEGGYLLHAAGLSFAHPVRGHRLKLRSLPLWI